MPSHIQTASTHWRTTMSGFMTGILLLYLTNTFYIYIVYYII